MNDVATRVARKFRKTEPMGRLSWEADWEKGRHTGRLCADGQLGPRLHPETRANYMPEAGLAVKRILCGTSGTVETPRMARSPATVAAGAPTENDGLILTCLGNGRAHADLEAA